LGRIGLGDLVDVSVNDLVGLGVETSVEKRVADPQGTVNLPLIGDIKVAGLTDSEAQRPIADAYRDGDIISNAQIFVTTKEATSRRFTIIGSAVEKPGAYYITDSNYRLIEALTVADVHLEGLKTVLVIRKGEGSKTRTLKIPVAELIAGDSGVNVAIHIGDAIILPPPAKPSITALVEAPMDKKVADHGEFWIGGSSVKRVGVYTLPAGGITLKQAIISAGGLNDGYVRVFRRVSGKETLALDNVEYSKLLSGAVNDIELHPGDTVMVNATSQPWLGPTTQQAVTP
jgi:protein involved in polysaccharide export with SLBB domain